MPASRLAFLTPLAALIGCLGCGGGSAGPKTVNVSGTVSLDGKPMPAGTVSFAKEGEPPQQLKVADGNFAGTAYAGKNSVQFAVYAKAPPPKVKGPGYDAPSETNILPPRFHRASKETCEVADGAKFDFKVESK